jgi:protein-L-isoaspartate(D-aspartate) O-methyltransferase
MTPEPRRTGAAPRSAPSAELLRASLVDQLRELGAIRSDRVADAFRTVPRHLFAPGAPLEAAYANDVVIAKRDRRGVALSSVSAPQIQAMMLEQAQLGLGMRALEIGSGGYNAALMAELVGPHGQIATVDIDPDVVDRARRCLLDAGYRRVNVVLADGEEGAAEHAPYDRLIVTVGAWDIPPAWAAQLADGGTITVPLRIRA